MSSDLTARLGRLREEMLDLGRGRKECRPSRVVLQRWANELAEVHSLLPMQCDDVEIVRAVTDVCREADAAFEKSGGSSRHWVSECFLPLLNDRGLKVQGADVEAALTSRPAGSLTITGPELNYVTHAASLRGQSLLEYVTRAINAALIKQGVDAELFAENDETAAIASPQADSESKK